MSFFIAMQNRRATASYLHPQTILSERNEFLIVSRSGGRNQFLSISNAGASTGNEDEAPAELRPNHVILATLVSQGPDDRDEIFVVEREFPISPSIDGIPVAGDGFICLTTFEDDLRLRGSVRLRPGEGTRSVAQSCPLLTEDEEGCTVHIAAGYLPWSNELLPRGFVKAGTRIGGSPK